MKRVLTVNFCYKSIFLQIGENCLPEKRKSTVIQSRVILHNEKTGCKIFILNYEEITKYMDTAEKRICLPTEYALQRSKNVIAAGNYRWWLRTDDSSFGTNYVDKDGTIVYASKNDTHATYFVRPVLWVIK